MEASSGSHEQSWASSWIKISISNDDRHLHAVSKVFMNWEKNKTILEKKMFLVTAIAADSF